MQPYFFPYIGYLQLINAVDRFISYDDVSYIKQGWINRNRILLSGKPFYITVPVKNQSSFRPIKDIKINNQEPWRKKIVRTLDQAYKKAPYFDCTIELFLRVIYSKEKYIARLALTSLKEVCSYLDIQTEFVDSSSLYNNDYLKGQQRVLDICVKENSSAYINPIGGQDLYSPTEFSANNIDLRILECKTEPYKQFSNEFVPNLSIIDVLMFNPLDQIRLMLKQFKLFVNDR